MLKKPDFIKKIDNKILDVLLHKKNKGLNIIDSTDKQLIVFSDKHKVFIKFNISPHKDDDKLAVNVFMVYYPSEIISQKKLAQIFSGNNHGSHHFYFYKDGHEEITPKTKKVQDILEKGAAYFLIYNRFNPNTLNKEEQADYDIFSKVLMNSPLQSQSIQKTYIFAQETNILSDVLNIKRDTNLFKLENLKGLDGDMTLLPQSVEYLFETCRDNKFTKNKPLDFHNEKFYYFKYQQKEFLYSQSQNSGYLFEKTDNGFDGHILGYECIRKNLKQLFNAQLSPDTLSLKIENEKITFVDSWIDYNSYVIYPAVEKMHQNLTGQSEPKETILEDYLIQKRKEHMESALPEKPKKSAKKI